MPLWCESGWYGIFSAGRCGILRLARVIPHTVNSHHHHRRFIAYFRNKKIYQVVFNRHKQGNPPQTILSIIIILNKIVILILIMDDLEFSLVEIGKSDPSLGASKNQLHPVGGQFSLHMLQYQHHHICRGTIFFACFLISTSSHIHLHWVPSMIILSPSPSQKYYSYLANTKL